MRFTLPFLLILFSATAHAQKVVIVPPYLDPGVSDQTAADVMSAITVQFTDQGMQVLANLPRDCAPGPGRAYRECAKSARDELSADMVVIAKIPASAGGGPSPEVELALIEGDTSYEGSAAFDSIGPVIRELLERRIRGPGQWIVVAGKPAGAEVLVNERPIGRLPECRGAIEPGIHHIAVRHAGYSDHNQALVIAIEPGAEQRVEVALAPEPVEVGPVLETPPPPRDSQAWRPIVGRTLIVVGLVLMIPPIIQAVQTGDCALNDWVRECEVVDPLEPYEVVGTIVGGGMIASGIFTLVYDF